MSFLYEKRVELKTNFNILLRLAIGFPFLILLASFFFFEGVNVSLIFFMILFLFSSTTLLFFFKSKFVGEYYFSVSNTMVESSYMNNQNDDLTYRFSISSIKRLIKNPDSLNAINSNVAYVIMLSDRTRYILSSNFISPDKVFKIIIQVRPDLNISSK